MCWTVSAASVRRPGSFPGSNTGVDLSHTVSDTSTLGVNMAEYVLGSSPHGARLHVNHRYVSSRMLYVMYLSLALHWVFCQIWKNNIVWGWTSQQSLLWEWFKLRHGQYYAHTFSPLTVSAESRLIPSITDIQHGLLCCYQELVYRVSTTPGNTGNTGNLLEFEIPPGNTGNLLDFCWCSWKNL